MESEEGEERIKFAGKNAGKEVGMSVQREESAHWLAEQGGRIEMMAVGQLTVRVLPEPKLQLQGSFLCFALVEWWRLSVRIRTALGVRREARYRYQNLTWMQDKKSRRCSRGSAE